jgi:exodeoxyribonuclease VII large subunit
MSSPQDDAVYTVTELTRRVKNLLESGFRAVWVEGELSNVKRHTSGHVYFTVKDDRASLKGILWRSNASRLRFTPEDGQKVRVYGSLTVYEPQGAYQISALRIDPLGVGDLEVAYRQMYERLESEGLFAPEHKRPLPAFPGIVGVVTSESGAAFEDLRSVIGRRAPHVRIVLRPARVQGEGAAADIANGIRELDDWGGADLLIVGRGGGSLEDLWAFNEEIVARALFACRTPVVSAVGHEIDTTIADFVADLRAPTPSAAAELAVPERDVLRAETTRHGDRLAAGLRRWLAARTERVQRLGTSSAFRRPLDFYRRRGQDLDRLVERRDAAMKRRVEALRLRLDSREGRLSALSPLAVLDRGYAIVRDGEGRVLRQAADVETGRRVRVRLGRGELACLVEEVAASAAKLGAGGETTGGDRK